MQHFDTYWQQAQDAERFLKERGLFSADVVIQCGSGQRELGPLLLPDATRVSIADIPSMPVANVSGHGKELLWAAVGPFTVAVITGRVHLYEGYNAATAGFSAALAKALGAKVFICLNAAGSLNQELPAGSIMVHGDYINNLGDNPLRHIELSNSIERFVNVVPAYHPTLAGLLAQHLKHGGAAVGEGVYLSTHGPVFETRAELNMMRAWGADAVGMSTVPEVQACHLMKLAVLGVSSITNEAFHPHAVSAEDVLSAAQSSVPTLATGLRSFLEDASWHSIETWPMA
jgi:purine-nucleoside phosphorylase